MLQKVHSVFWKHIWFKHGSGREICFWEDRWVGDIPFRESFRSLYFLAIDPKGLVANVYDVLGNIWAPRLDRNLNDWEWVFL